ncbi:MAG: YdbL family protein [Proteobacteria bacterium]|nr:YdbL family protein [Pseudomonadota bacterium]
MHVTCIKWLVAGMCGLLAACAIITVNVYFPEKAVKEAYKSLDDVLLKNGTGKAPDAAKPPAAEPGATEPGATDSKPQSNLFNDLPVFSFCAVAHAAENYADDLAIELASMPEVIKAYDGMSKRLPRLTALFDNAAVGLTNQGLVTVRDKTKITAQDVELVNRENQSRKVVVTSMAKAILKITKVKESKGALAQVLGKAAATYADTRREEAKPGWWIQLANGRWVQK